MLPLGLAFVGVDLASLHRSVGVQTLLLWAFAPVFSVAYVRACSIVSGRPPTAPALAAAVIVFLPFPVLVRLYVLPGLVWFGLIGLAVPAAVVEGLGIRAALRRGWQLGRADAMHAVGGLATLALVYGVTRYALLVLIHTQGGQTQTVAAVLADLVLSPLVFVGAALLYADQAARVTTKYRATDDAKRERRALRDRDAADGHAPGLPGGEQLVRVDLVRPAEEVRLGVVARCSRRRPGRPRSPARGA